jgi:hypothetical protein
MLPPIKRQKPEPKKDGKCKIRVRKSQDGRVIDREISPECTNPQIKALLESKKLEEEA